MLLLLVADSHPPVPEQHHQTGSGERGPQETNLRPRGCGELLPPPCCFFPVVCGLESSRIVNNPPFIRKYTFWVLVFVRPHIRQHFLSVIVCYFSY